MATQHYKNGLPFSKIQINIKGKQIFNLVFNYILFTCGRCGGAEIRINDNDWWLNNNIVIEFLFCMWCHTLCK